VLTQQGNVLEIGSCTGQHVVHFAAAFPGLTWQPSDRKENLAGLSARIEQQAGRNVLSAIELDVTRTWPELKFDAVYSANTSHIMSWDEVRAMFSGTGVVLKPNGVFCLYGPFNRDGQFTSKSNEVFDRSLRNRNPAMGIRDVEALESLGLQHQITLTQQYALPANNSLLVFHKIPA
jgi:cyclopropane fatty-acyl-phospholipid synthase-like methyltransferase